MYKALIHNNITSSEGKSESKNVNDGVMARSRLVFYAIGNASKEIWRGGRQVVAVDLWQQGVIELLMAQQMEMEGSP